MRTTLLALGTAALLLGPACGDPALQKRYESLQHEHKIIQEEMTRLSNDADRVFYETTSAERQAGRAITGAARCSAPKGTYRPAAPLSFGPVKLRYQTHDYSFTEAAPFETASLQCVQASVSHR